MHFECLPKIHLGDVPTWLGVLFAAVAGIAAWLLYLREAERDEQARKDRVARDNDARQDQARQVCAWFGGNDLGPEDTRFFRNAWGVNVLNMSNLPIYSLTVDFYVIEEESGEPAEQVPGAKLALTVVPPGGRFLNLIGVDLPKTEAGSTFLVAITFRDTANRWWRREVDGGLVATAPR